MENIPDSVLGFALGNLKELIVSTYKLISGAEDSVKKLCDELDVLNGFIKAMESYSNSSSESLRQVLIDKAREEVYHAEDVIERFIVSASLQKDRGTLDKTLHSVDYTWDIRGVAQQIEAISQDVQKFYEKKAPLGIADMQVNAIRNINQKKKEVDLVVELEENDVVGFDNEVREVINLLKGESETLEVLLIVGMPGLGKTTLAKKVISDPIIKSRFPARAFVNVSQEYDRKKVFLNILRALPSIPEKVHDMTDQQLIDEIQKCLITKKYLFVMDDIGTPEAWTDLKRAFPDKEGSMVLITSQRDRVASHANPNSVSYRLRLLTVPESVELLRRRVFGKDSCPKKLVKYQQKIAEKCEGFPLKVVLLAGILQDDRERTELWKDVAEDKYASVISDVIRMCYENLPYHLKPCFLYLGVFHEDVEIPVWKLVQLWVAEGFVQQDENEKMSLEDSAESYLRDLVKRNLVMVTQKRANGQIKTCRIHGTLREFCKQQAIKENLFQEIKGCHQASFLTAAPSKFNYRRLFINSHVMDYIAAIPPGMPVRSFLSFSKEEVVLDSKLVSSIPKAFELLRVLDVRSVKFPDFPDDLLNLILLKYISISCDSNTLPKKVSKLQRLQTLIIQTQSPTLVIKAAIWKMSQLRHLYTNASTCIPSPPTTTKKPFICHNLKTLSTISPECCRKDLLQRTPNIKKLGIRGELEASLFDSLSSLEFVENLKLMNEGNKSKLLALPQWNNSLTKLTRLTLRNTMLNWNDMSTLGKLENLLVLKLKDNAFQGKSWRTEDGGFPCLEVLHIGKTNLDKWEASEYSFPFLSHLILRHCSELKEIPPAFQRIADLKNIELYYTNSSVASSALKLQLYKLQVQKMSSFQLSVVTSEHRGSEKELQRTDKVSDEPNTSRGKYLEEGEVQQEPQKYRANKLVATEFSQESKASSSGKEMQRMKVSEEPKKSSRGNEMQTMEGSEEPKKPRKSKSNRSLRNPVLCKGLRSFFTNDKERLENRRKNQNIAYFKHS